MAVRCAWKCRIAYACFREERALMLAHRARASGQHGFSTSSSWQAWCRDTSRDLIHWSTDNLPAPKNAMTRIMVPQSVWSLIPDSLMSGYATTATMLNTNSASAVGRDANPRTKRAGNISSAPVPEMAASVGEITGTFYSFSNNATVDEKSSILVSPDLKNTWAT